VPRSKPVTMKTPEVMAALRARHGDTHAWVTVEEAHRIDFLALACHGAYSDRRAARMKCDAHHPWIGYEVKVSRADFRNEIKKPEKRAYAVAVTHEFYFCAPAGLIRPEEVPEDCGLVEVHATGTSVKVRAPITEAEPMSHLHLAQMFRHGINPAFIRNYADRAAHARYMARQGDEAVKKAKRREDELGRLLEEYAGSLVTVGSRWVSRKPGWDFAAGEKTKRYDTVTVLDVGEMKPEWRNEYRADCALTVKYTDPRPDPRFQSWDPRLPMPTFLEMFRPAEAAATIAA
jgi:hypothetical protein